MENNEYKQLMLEIEKMKFHNSSLLALIGTLEDENGEGTQYPTIHETIVKFDLSKQDFRELTTLIQSYEGDSSDLEQKALEINPVFKRKNLIFILKSFLVSEMLEEKIGKILKSYE